MNLTVKIKRFVKRKIATAVLVTASVAAFATLGDGGKKNSNTLLNPSKSTLNARGLTLRGTYNYRGNNLFSTGKPKFITLNTTMTYQRGNATYIVPLKKKVILDKVKFNPTPSRF